MSSIMFLGCLQCWPSRGQVACQPTASRLVSLAACFAPVCVSHSSSSAYCLGSLSATMVSENAMQHSRAHMHPIARSAICIWPTQACQKLLKNVHAVPCIAFQRLHSQSNELMRHWRCNAAAGAFFAAIIISTIRTYVVKPKYRKFVPIPMCLGIPAYIGGYFVIDM